MKKSTQSLLIFSLTIWGGATYSQTTNNLLSPVGKVGIGTMTPQSRLHVVGNTKIDSALTARSLNVMQLSTYQGNAIFQKRLGVAGLTVLDSVVIGGPIELPNIGGLPNSNQVMDILMRDPLTGEVFKGTIEQLRSSIYNSPTDSDGSCGDGGPYSDINPIWKNGIDKIYYKCPQVRVGIGTDAPAYTLDVKGNGFFQSDLTVTADLKVSKQLFVGSFPTDFTGKVYVKNIVASSNTDVVMLIENNQKRLFQLNNDGALDIAKQISIGGAPSNFGGKLYMKNNVAPSNTDAIVLIENNERKLLQLDNTGLLYAREIKVNLDAWPDYVFDATYQLMPIKTLEQYIQTNKHLPGVPSACEVEENGLSLGEMNKILLEKLEEMTLRMIEQEKRISELETNAVTKN